MKKAFILFVSVIICLTCTISQADVDQELFFQGVPWFSSPEEVSNILFDSGFINSYLLENEIKSVNNIKSAKVSSIIGLDDKDKKVPYTFRTSKNPPITDKLQLAALFRSQLAKTIAKQPLSGVNLHFTSEPDNPQLVECVLTFSAKYDHKAVYEALEQSYGKPTAVKNHKKTDIWLGTNNTIVIYQDNTVVFATIDGLILAEQVNIPTTEKEDTGF